MFDDEIVGLLSATGQIRVPFSGDCSYEEGLPMAGTSLPSCGLLALHSLISRVAVQKWWSTEARDSSYGLGG